VYFIVVLSSGLYFSLGDVVRVAQKFWTPVTQEGVEKMVAEFAIKMEKILATEGWAMLARSYRILGRNEDAKAYAGDYINSDPQY
jgi:cytochrome c-type biogenesis protein CcmH